ncbi:fibrinogen alpha chain-like isoform X2 [Protopterus annectens]|uniref:fibrinogen alpha chain-like isoform X2 n=1 Tax=Protopterus annectens TaxID=7888 RepID=UPI001CF93283|nr:fibrinogen alpha chain-like isoform X2 [Protopterus annectens]
MKAMHFLLILKTATTIFADRLPSLDDSPEAFIGVKSSAACPIEMTPIGGCNYGQDCTYQVNLPPVTIQMPEQFKLLEETIKQVQELREAVQKLSLDCKHQADDPKPNPQSPEEINEVEGLKDLQDSIKKLTETTNEFQDKMKDVDNKVDTLKSTVNSLSNKCSTSCPLTPTYPDEQLQPYKTATTVATTTTTTDIRTETTESIKTVNSDSTKADTSTDDTKGATKSPKTSRVQTQHTKETNVHGIKPATESFTILNTGTINKDTSTDATKGTARADEQHLIGTTVHGIKPTTESFIIINTGMSNTDPKSSTQNNTSSKPAKPTETGEEKQPKESYTTSTPIQKTKTGEEKQPKESYTTSTPIQKTKTGEEKQSKESYTTSTPIQKTKTGEEKQPKESYTTSTPIQKTKTGEEKQPKESYTTSTPIQKTKTGEEKQPKESYTTSTPIQKTKTGEEKQPKESYTTSTPTQKTKTDPKNSAKNRATSKPAKMTKIDEERHPKESYTTSTPTQKSKTGVATNLPTHFTKDYTRPKEVVQTETSTEIPQVATGVPTPSARRDNTATPKTVKDCSSYYQQGERRSGIYPVIPDSKSGPFEVYCDMETEGGGWTVLQVRRDGTVKFNTTWDQYKKGFGSLTGEFWLGNDHIHNLTKATEMGLRIELEDFHGNKKYAEYKQFYVSNEFLRYRLTIGDYRGTAGDAMRYSKKYNHDQRYFTTHDRDNDRYPSGNCGAYYSSGWWFDACMSANLNGKFYKKRYTGVRNGIFWGTWPTLQEENLHGYRESFKFVRMMIKPRALMS